MFEVTKVEQLLLVSSVSTQLKTSCNEARRISAGSVPNYNDAVLVYDSTRLSIEDARIHPDLLRKSRGAAMANISWLSSYGFEFLSEDLQDRLGAVDTAAR